MEGRAVNLYIKTDADGIVTDTTYAEAAMGPMLAKLGYYPADKEYEVGDDTTPEPVEPEPTEVDQLKAQVADLQNQILTMRLGGI